ncbi:MAG: NINE protein [Clostridiales bacterium]|nr:NINE protein [Clostridiales bacterium]
MKNKNTALILSILVGPLGIDRFYLGYTGMGVLKLLTAGCFGILYIIDIVNIACGNLLPADGTPYEDSPKTAPTPVQTQPTNTLYDDLEKLAKLYKAGVLTDEEFAKAKSECLAKM